jgi:hypothetical protein
LELFLLFFSLQFLGIVCKSASCSSHVACQVVFFFK